MNCEETRELLAAYALDAASPDEAAAVERHLEGCRRHDAELRELRQGVDAVALAAPERDPAPESRSRLLAAFEAEAARLPAPVPLRAAGRARTWRSAPAFAYAAAAVLIIALAGLLAWNIALQTGGSDGGEGLVRVLSGDAGQGRLLYFKEEQAGLLELDLQAQPAELTYQAWAIYGEGPVSLGLVPSDGVAAFRADLGGASAVAISVEPAGGSAQPTSDPVLVATLD